HIRLKGLGDQYGPVFLLVVLHDSNEAAANRGARTIEGMDIAGRLLFARGAVARLHAPGLEVAADRNRGNLAVGILSRQPDFQIIGAAGAKTHVAGAKL